MLHAASTQRITKRGAVAMLCLTLLFVSGVVLIVFAATGDGHRSHSHHHGTPTLPSLE